jgi:predicted GIY-YIG superfamily endonuclease
MPIVGTRWDLQENWVDTDRDDPGVYELSDSQETVIYVGSAEKLKQRLKGHLNEKDNDCIKKKAKKYRLQYTSQYKAREKELYDEHVKTFGRPPACNKVIPSGK